MILTLTCKYSSSVKFCCGHHADEEDKAACAAEYCGERLDDDVTVLLEKYGVEHSTRSEMEYICLD